MKNYNLLYDEEFSNKVWKLIKKDDKCICGTFGVSLIESDYVEEFKTKYGIEFRYIYDDFDRIYKHIVEDFGCNQDIDSLNFYVGHEEFEDELMLECRKFTEEDLISFIKKASFRDKFYNGASATLIYNGMKEEMDYFLKENKKYINKKYLKEL